LIYAAEFRRYSFRPPPVSSSTNASKNARTAGESWANWSRSTIACPRAATFASAPARKCDDTRAEQPVATAIDA